MTAPRSPRARAARLPPPGRGPRARQVAALPSVELRRRRGPKPPDHVVAALVAALAIETGRADHTRTDAAPRRLGAAWRAAVSSAATATVRAARRGVVGALAGAGQAARIAREAPAAVARGWGARLTSAVEAAMASAREALLAAVAGAAAIRESVLQEHARLVQVIARRAGASRYLWTTMRDSRVRPLHVQLEGTIQRWDAPPLAGLPSFHGHPGDADECRCQAYPIL